MASPPRESGKSAASNGRSSSPTNASSFSSNPVAPVVANNHSRRQDTGWNKSKSSRDARSHAMEEDNQSEGSASDRGGDAPPPSRTSEKADAKANNAAPPSSATRRTSRPNSPYHSEVSDAERTSSDEERPTSPKREPRNSSMTLPSLSRAAMMHMRDGNNNTNNTNRDRADRDRGVSNRDDMGPSSYGASSGGDGGSAPARHHRRSRSRSRERSAPTNNNSNRWSNNPEKDGDRNDDVASSYSGDGGQREDEPPSPGRDGGDGDVRIMFHGREVYADDLIGLRVAKTFVGHGRFLGQVVKFDEPTSLYTIVYADGDAEELSIENTIQILIQDEIERADPSIPPVAAPIPHDRMPDSPDGGNSTPSTTAAPVVPVAQQQQQLQQPPGSMGASRRPPAGNMSEREAQFVIGLFENHALPTLMRQGWRVQSNSSGTEQRFYAPPGSFRGAGQVYTSALDVVELIASDNELLSVCFPQNVHAAILSLFPEPAVPPSRKRLPPGPSDVDGYDAKRARGPRPDMYGPAGGSTRMARAGGGSVSGPGPMVPPPSRGEDRLVPPVGYRPDDREFRERERDAYGSGRIPSLATDRFAARGPPPGRPDHPRADPSEYRRMSGGGDYRSMPMRSFAQESANGPSSRWSGSGPPPGGPEYRHPHGEDWRERDPRAMPPGPGYMSSRGAPMGQHGVDEADYYGERGGPRGAVSMRGSSGGVPGDRGTETPPPHTSSYRYRDVKTNGPGYSPGAAESYGHRYPVGREHMGSDYRGGPPPPQPGSAMDDRFGRPTGRGGSSGIAPGAAAPAGRGFSMMDVDRANARSGPPRPGYERMERGRSPRSADDPAGPSGYPSGHYHRRSASNGNHYGMDPSGAMPESNGGRPGSANPNPADDPRPI